jgi:hypothetical protein
LLLIAIVFTSGNAEGERDVIVVYM